VFVDVDPSTSPDPNQVEALSPTPPGRSCPCTSTDIPRASRRSARSAMTTTRPRGGRLPGAWRRARRPSRGSFGTGCFSFYPTKNMTTGEGGIITTNDRQSLARRASSASRAGAPLLPRALRTQLAAHGPRSAIGLVQLGHLEDEPRAHRDAARCPADHRGRDASRARGRPACLPPVHGARERRAGRFRPGFRRPEWDRRAVTPCVHRQPLCSSSASTKPDCPRRGGCGLVPAADASLAERGDLEYMARG